MPNEQPIEPIEIEEEPEESQEQEILSIMDQLEARHAMTNIAEDLEQDVIDTIAAKVVDDYNTDKDSRSVWEESNRELMKLAKLDSEKKTYAGERVANVKYPIITNAAIQFAARAYPEIIKGSDVVKPKVIGEDPDGQKAERGKRLCDHMSYQLLNDMPDWEDGVDQMLFTLPVVGCAFKKTYYSAVESQNIEDNDSVDEDTPHKFLEQHRWYDLDKDGYQEPYIVTVHLATQKLVRISARFELKGVETNDKDEIVRIKPTHYFTRFLFMPAPDGSFYGMGFGSLLHSINSATNTALNQLLDAGTLSNRQSGFLGRGIQLGRGASLKFQSGEWKPVQTTGDDLRKNIVPLPTKEPSHVLFQLLGLLIDTGKELSGITEVLSGQSPGSNVPAETTLALIEQGLQVYSATHKRIHRSLYREFQKIRRLNVLYLSDEEYSTVLDSPKAIRRQDYENSDLDIIPVSDSNATTNMQRIMKAKALFEIKGQGLNDEEINKRYLEALQVENIDELIPKEQEPDPILELEIETKKAELGKIMAEQGKLAADTELTVEKINTERNDQQVKQSGVVFDQSKLDLERAEIIASIKEREDKLKLETARLISGIENDKKKIDIDSKKIDNSKIEGKNAETSTKGYNEKGMKSNNVKQ
jgi:chaperonin GroES